MCRGKLSRCHTCMRKHILSNTSWDTCQGNCIMNLLQQLSRRFISWLIILCKKTPYTWSVSWILQLSIAQLPLAVYYSSVSTQHTFILYSLSKFFLWIQILGVALGIITYFYWLTIFLFFRILCLFFCFFFPPWHLCWIFLAGAFILFMLYSCDICLLLFLGLFPIFMSKILDILWLKKINSLIRKIELFWF